MIVQQLKVTLRKIKIKLYQKIADYLIITLNSAQEAKDDRLFDVLYEMAIRFNDRCVEKGIYLE